MSFIKKLNDTYVLLNNLDDVVIRDMGRDLVKKQLLFVSEDLLRYKDLDQKNTIFENDEVKLKINQILNRINEIEININNKLHLTEKYSSYINS